MALVHDIVVRFKSEAASYMAATDAVKAKNKEAAQSLLAAAGSAERAIASLQAAKKAGQLGAFNIDSRAVGGIIAAIKSQSREAANAAQQSGAAAGKSFVRGMKSQFGEDSTFGGLMKMAAGTGAVAGISMAANALANFGTKFAELSKAARTGREEWEKAMEQWTKSIPILGNLIIAVRDLYMELSGENALAESLKKTTEQADASRKQFQSMYETAQRITGELRQWQKGFESGAAELRAAALEAAGMTAEAARLRLDAKYQKRGEDEDAKAQAELDAVLNGNATKLADARKLAAERQAEAAKAQADFEAMVASYGPLIAARERNAMEHGENNKYSRYFDIVQQAKARAALAAADAMALEQQNRDAEEAYVRKVGDAANQRAKDLATERSIQQPKAFRQMGEQYGKAIGDGLSDMLARNAGVTGWLQQQNAAFGKAAEQNKQKAKAIRESLKTDADRMRSDIGDAAFLAKRGQLSASELDQYLTKTAKGLLKEQKDLGNGERAVYSLPNVTSMRAGQSLFVPPTKVDEASLKRLEEIRGLLQTIRDKAADGGVVVEELSL